MHVVTSVEQVLQFGVKLVQLLQLLSAELIDSLYIEHSVHS